MHDEIRDLLPAYCAGSLPDDLHLRVEEMLVRSPELLSEAAELSQVNDRLLEVRRRLDRQSGA